MERPRRWLGAGLALCLVASALRPLAAPPAPQWLRVAAERGRARPGPARMGIRDLRRLPGIGEGRARAVLEARRAWDDGELPRPACPTWSDVPGIGPITEAAVRARLEQEGLDAGAPLVEPLVVPGD